MLTLETLQAVTVAKRHNRSEATQTQRSGGYKSILAAAKRRLSLKIIWYLHSMSSSCAYTKPLLRHNMPQRFFAVHRLFMVWPSIDVRRWRRQIPSRRWINVLLFRSCGWLIGRFRYCQPEFRVETRDLQQFTLNFFFQETFVNLGFFGGLRLGQTFCRCVSTRSTWRGWGRRPNSFWIGT